MIRIITGKAKGTHLKIPDGIRPVTDRLKTVAFDILGDRVEERYVLDLFAGSGALGIEALSRGAKKATFVDYHLNSIETIEQNLKKTHLQSQAQIIQIKVGQLIEKPGFHPNQYNLVFIDPPYSELEQIELADVMKVVNPKATVILKLPFEWKELSQNWQVRQVGKNFLHFML